MIDWFHTLPNVLIGLILVSTAVTVCVILPTFIRRRYKLEVSADVAKGAEEGFKLMASMTMALLAFCLVQVQSIHRSVEDLAARESTIILKVSRALTDYGGDQGTTLRTKLRAYAESVANDEWPLLSKARRSVVTSERLEDLIRGCSQLQAETPAQQLAMAEVRGGMAQVSDVREARLSAAQINLAPYFWMAIAAVITILVVIGWFQGPLPKMIVYVGGVTLGISMLLTLLIVASGVYVGESRVTPSALVHVLPLLGP